MRTYMYVRYGNAFALYQKHARSPRIISWPRASLGRCGTQRGSLTMMARCLISYAGAWQTLNTYGRSRRKIAWSILGRLVAQVSCGGRTVADIQHHLQVPRDGIRERRRHHVAQRTQVPAGIEVNLSRMLRGIFYARFHPLRGPSILHQYPPDDPQVSFQEISAYIIPPYELCNRAFSICASGNRVLGFPISLESSKYERNRFTFNVCFVLDEKEDGRAWAQVVKKTARFFQELEEEDESLQAEEDLDGLIWAGEAGYPASNKGEVFSLLEAIVKDLSRYEEACIRLRGGHHVLNLRLAPLRPYPAEVQTWDVPLLIRELPRPEQWTWDLALHRIEPFIDGIKHVQRISELADVEMKLVKEAIKELIYHERVTLLDVFHFQAVYVPTADLALLAKDGEAIAECSNYITIEPSKNVLASTDARPNISTGGPSTTTVCSLYASLSPGQSVREFVIAHRTQLSGIDVRRFITFGVLKGFVRRVHKYAVLTTPSRPAHLNGNTDGVGLASSLKKSSTGGVSNIDRAWRDAALSSGWATPPSEPTRAQPAERLDEAKDQMSDDTEAETRLTGLLDGRHCLDELCIAVGLSEGKVLDMLRSGDYKDVVILSR